MTATKSQKDNSLAERIKRLEAIQDILMLKSVYCRHCDSDYDPDQLASLFCPDGVLDLGEKFGFYKGKKAIIKHFNEISSQFVFASHLATNPEIKIESSEKAKGTWQLIMPCNMQIGNSVESRWLFGEYQDKFSYVNGEWKFSEIKVVHRVFAKHLDGWTSTLVV